MRKMNIFVINGPNMNLLGLREPEIYGNKTLQDLENELTKLAGQSNVTLSFFQSNHEGKIVDYIQEHLSEIDGIILNPAGLSKTGYSILDAMTSINIPFVEVHVSNIYGREEWHTESLFASYAIGQITGFGIEGYSLALTGLIEHLS